MTLTEFLLARIAEDERRYGRGHYPLWIERRMVAECEVKRRLMERVKHPAWAGFRILALPYIDHPDYNPDWRP